MRVRTHLRVLANRRFRVRGSKGPRIQDVNFTKVASIQPIAFPRILRYQRVSHNNKTNCDYVCLYQSNGLSCIKYLSHCPFVARCSSEVQGASLHCLTTCSTIFSCSQESDRPLILVLASGKIFIASFFGRFKAESPIVNAERACLRRFLELGCVYHLSRTTGHHMESGYVFCYQHPAPTVDPLPTVAASMLYEYPVPGLSIARALGVKGMLTSTSRTSSRLGRRRVYG